MVNLSKCDKVEILINGEWHIGYFSQDNTDSIPPQDYHRYAIRESDFDDDRWVTLENYVFVNRAGFFFTKEDMKISDYLEIQDWDFK